jgi:hypothetical protein
MQNTKDLTTLCIQHNNSNLSENTMMNMYTQSKRVTRKQFEIIKAMQSEIQEMIGDFEQIARNEKDEELIDVEFTIIIEEY